jgi:hypothetical protein
MIRQFSPRFCNMCVQLMSGSLTKGANKNRHRNHLKGKTWDSIRVIDFTSPLSRPVSSRCHRTEYRVTFLKSHSNVEWLIGRVCGHRLIACVHLAHPNKELRRLLRVVTPNLQCVISRSALRQCNCCGSIEMKSWTSFRPINTQGSVAATNKMQARPWRAEYPQEHGTPVVSGTPQHQTTRP